MPVYGPPASASGAGSGTLMSACSWSTIGCMPVPNAAIWGSPIANYSFNARRRVDLVVGIAYEDDIGKAVDAISAVIEADARIHKDPAPLVAPGELADSSVNLLVQAWCASPDFGPVKFALIRSIKERLESEGITIPYPQRQVRLVQA